MAMNEQQQVRQRVKQSHRKSSIVPDRMLEESVILSNNQYLRNYLPADDIAPTMYQEGLLTEEEYAHYKQLKALATPAANKSECLMSCLIKRRDGYLRKFCEILCNITGAEHIAEHLDDQYVKATKAGVSLSGIAGSKWISRSAHDIFEKVDNSKDQCCSKCKDLKKENKQLRKSQRWLEIQLEGLKRDKLQLRQANIFSQNLIQRSKKQLEVMEENGRKLGKLVPLLQQTAALIECSRGAQEGLSASLDHTDEWFSQSLNSPPGKRYQFKQSSQPEDHHIQQSSIQTHASSILSSDISSDCEGEPRPWHSLVSEKLRRLSADIVATFPTLVSYESHGIMTDYDQLTSGTPPIYNKDDGLNARIPLVEPFSDGHYDHLSGFKRHNNSGDRVTKTDKQNPHIYS